MPLSLQRRVYRLVLSYLYDELPKQFTYVHEQLFLEIFQEEGTNKVIDFPNGLKVERAYNQARLYFQTDRNIEPFLGKLQSVPSSIRLPDGHVLTLTYTDKDKCDRADTYIFSEDQVRFPLHIRNRKPGDRMSWEGLQGSKKIKDIFIDEKVPQDERDKMYIVTDDMGVIMWLIGMKKGKLADSKGAGPYIMLTYKSTS